MRSVFLLVAFWWANSCLAESHVPPVPESKQAAQAMEIIDAYHNPRPSKPPKKLYLIYYTPADREPEPNYAQRLSAILEDIRNFYRDGMERAGFGPKTFDMERDGAGKLVFHLVKGKSPESSFPTWTEANRPGTGSPAGGKIVLNECEPTFKSAGISLNHETILFFSNLTSWDEKQKTFRHHSPYYGHYEQGSGYCYAADSVILNVDDIPKPEPVIHDQQWGDMTFGHFETVFIGGIAHELGHAFALPHCGERWDEKSLGTSIMGIGNHTYREERAGKGKGSFLTMASAMRLASHPLFNCSKKGWGEEPRLQCCELALSTNLTRADLAGRHGTLRLEGTVAGSPPVYGIVAYFDSIHDDGYRSPAASSVPDAQGRFAVEISDLVPTGNGELRVEFCHANGSISERELGFTVTPDGDVDFPQWRMQQALQPIADAVHNGQSDAARASLAELEKGDASELSKTIARKLVATLSYEPKPSPAAVPLEVTKVCLGDLQPQSSRVGWLTPSANRVPEGGEVASPFLDSGTLHATGFFAHSPSRYAFDLGGKWKTLRGEAGLHTAFQNHAYGVVFIIKTDGREVFRSRAVRGTENPNYEIDVTGVKTLELLVEQAGARNGANWALWLDPTLSR